MIGLGTNLKSHFGWKCDATTGEPEVYYWQGTVHHYVEHWYDGNRGAEGGWYVNYAVDADATKSNKLYKLTFDHTNRKVGRTLVWDGKDTFVNTPASSGGDLSKRFGNLEFISRDVFVITEEWSPADPSGLETDTYRRVILWANRLNEDGSVTPKIWKRVLLDNSVQDAGEGDPGANQFDYPGIVLGITSISPKSDAYDTYEKWKNILVMTSPGPFGYPWWAGSNNNHKRLLMRLNTDDSDITNPDYLADSDAWHQNQAETTGAFKIINQIPLDSNFSGHGAREGWITAEDDGTILYGTVQGYKDNEEPNYRLRQSKYGYLSQTAGGTGIYYDSVDGGWEDGVGGSAVPERIYYHDVGLISNIENATPDINYSNAGNHVVCKFDAGYTYDFHNGIRWDFNMSENTQYGPNGNGNGTPEHPDYGWYFYYWNNRLSADAACTDIFGTTKWGKEHGKNVVISLVARNGKDMLWNLPDDGWDNAFAANREGIVVFRRQGAGEYGGGSNILSLLDYRDFSFDHDTDFVDRNGFRRVTYQFDSSWGTIYDSPCCLDANGFCQYGEEVFQSDCENAPDWAYDNDQETSGRYDFAGAATVDEANTGDSNGNIPTLYFASQPFTQQPFYSAVANGLSFRPNWLY